jgi:hypothetical protein
MYDRFTWPGFDRTNDFPFHKVINEPDFLPLFFLRHVAQAGKILRRSKGHLRITPAGRRMLEQPHPPALQAVLFHIAFWHFDLGYLSRGLHYGWPQRNAGIVLWSLSVAANLVNICPAYARSPLMACSRRHGIQPPSQWRRRSCDLFNGSVGPLVILRLPGRQSLATRPTHGPRLPRCVPLEVSARPTR